MLYAIYKLKFPRGVHFGNSINASLEISNNSLKSDTLFAAIYNEYLKMYNDDEFLKIIDEDKFFISDLLPYKNEKMYLPKPIVNIKRQVEIKEEKFDRKKFKKLSHIPVENLQEYFDFLRYGRDISDVDNDFGVFELVTKNQISRTGEDTNIYNIEVFRFNEWSGLYFIANLEEKFLDRFDMVLNQLAISGIGGKKSIGFGEFDIEKRYILANKDKKLESNSKSLEVFKELLYKETKYKLLLSSYIPKKEEISKLKVGDSSYQLIKSSGFVNSRQYSKNPLKRKQVYMIRSGSVVDFNPIGRFLDLNLHGNHPIYRMAKPLCIGVDL